MKINKHDSKIVVELESEKIKYSSEWLDEKNFLTSDGVKKLEEWKIDLIKNYGVDEDELPS